MCVLRSPYSCRNQHAGESQRDPKIYCALSTEQFFCLCILNMTIYSLLINKPNPKSYYTGYREHFFCFAVNFPGYSSGKFPPFFSYLGGRSRYCRNYRRNSAVPGTAESDSARKWITVSRQKNTAKLKTAPPVSAKKPGIDEYPDNIHQYIGAYQ